MLALLQVVTGVPEIRVIRDGFTYMNITKTPLRAVLMAGSPSRVSRGWDQPVSLLPEKYSLDPDDPEDKANQVINSNGCQILIRLFP